MHGTEGGRPEWNRKANNGRVLAFRAHGIQSCRWRRQNRSPASPAQAPVQSAARLFFRLMQASWRLHLGARTRTLHSIDRLCWLLGHVYRLVDRAASLGPLLYGSVPPLSLDAESFSRVAVRRERSEE